ncbi:MAG TPA: PEP-CTERM sorting domain-containing protein, partial [Bryobacteraceae bacterium]|nr:PEP-CTERM sorting domain-containing protein [Bryobacteraceae bacterium]
VSTPGAFGFTNVTDPCFNGTTVCANPGQYLFFDDFHPTTAANSILAQRFEAAVVPEPGTLVLMGGAMLAIFVVRRVHSGLRTIRRSYPAR